jgi:predicted MPP superfamily phosphohydrolase
MFVLLVGEYFCSSTNPQFEEEGNLLQGLHEPSKQYVCTGGSQYLNFYYEIEL